MDETATRAGSISCERARVCVSVRLLARAARRGLLSARRTARADHRDVVERFRTQEVLAHRFGELRDAAKRGVGAVEPRV